MKKLIMMLFGILIIFNLSYGYTFTVDDGRSKLVNEMESGNTVFVGFEEAEEIRYVVKQGSVSLTEVVGRPGIMQFVMPSEDVWITLIRTGDIKIITASAGANGSISPSGRTSVVSGQNQTFEFTPDLGYTVDYVLVDGVNVGAPTSYTFTDVTDFHTISVIFKQNMFTVTLNQQSGSSGTESVTSTYGFAMPTITVPTRTGYTFGGYYTGTNGSGMQYYNADGSSARNWDIAAATTLYAKWIDTLAPATPGTPNLVTEYDTGSSNTDNITKLYENIVIDGTAEAGSTVLIYKAGTYHTETTADANGYWRASITNNFNVWTNYTVTARDASGNVSGESGALSIYSDTIAPSAPTIETKYSAFECPYQLDCYSVSPLGQVGRPSNNDPKILFTTDTIQNISKVNIYLGSGGISAATSVQVFYGIWGASYPYNQENSVTTWVSAGTEYISLTIPTGTYPSIRLDIGDSSSLTYQINRVDFTAPANQSHGNTVNLISSTDGVGIWKYQKYQLNWVDCSSWDEYATSTAVDYRALDIAGNAAATVNHDTT